MNGKVEINRQQCNAQYSISNALIKERIALLSLYNLPNISQISGQLTFSYNNYSIIQRINANLSKCSHKQATFSARSTTLLIAQYADGFFIQINLSHSSFIIYHSSFIIYHSSNSNSNSNSMGRMDNYEKR